MRKMKRKPATHAGTSCSLASSFAPLLSRLFDQRKSLALPLTLLLPFSHACVCLDVKLRSRLLHPKRATDSQATGAASVSLLQARVDAWIVVV